MTPKREYADVAELRWYWSDAAGDMGLQSNFEPMRARMQVGGRTQDVLKARRAEHGAEIVAALGRQLEERFGRGFGEKNLRRISDVAKFREVVRLTKAFVLLEAAALRALVEMKLRSPASLADWAALERVFSQTGVVDVPAVEQMSHRRGAMNLSRARVAAALLNTAI